MSLKRKLKRAAMTDAKKKIEKTAKPYLKKYQLGKQIAELNGARISDFCQAYYLPLFAYVMFKHFGYGYRRLERLGAVITKLIHLVAETKRCDELRAKGVIIKDGDPKQPHHYLSISEVKEGLLAEAKYKFEPTPSRDMPDSKEDVKEFATWYAIVTANNLADNLRAIWLLTLNNEFGFGAGRLAKAVECLQLYQEMTREEFLERLEEVETKCKYQGKQIRFVSSRLALERLGIDKDMSIDLSEVKTA